MTLTFTVSSWGESFQLFFSSSAFICITEQGEIEAYSNQKTARASITVGTNMKPCSAAQRKIKHINGSLGSFQVGAICIVDDKTDLIFVKTER